MTKPKAAAGEPVRAQIAKRIVRKRTVKTPVKKTENGEKRLHKHWRIHSLPRSPTPRT